MLGGIAPVPIRPSPDLRRLHQERTQAIAMRIRRLPTSSLFVLNRVKDICKALTETGLFFFRDG